MTDQPPPEASDAFRLGAEVDQPPPVSAEQQARNLAQDIYENPRAPYSPTAIKKLALDHQRLQAELQAAQDELASERNASREFATERDTARAQLQAAQEREKELRKHLQDIERTKWWSATQARSHAIKGLAAQRTEAADAQFECGCWFRQVGVQRHPAITGDMCCPIHRKPYKQRTEEAGEQTCPDCYGKGLQNQDDKPGLLLGPLGEFDCMRCRGTGKVRTEEADG